MRMSGNCEGRYIYIYNKIRISVYSTIFILSCSKERNMGQTGRIKESIFQPLFRIQKKFFKCPLRKSHCISIKHYLAGKTFQQEIGNRYGTDFRKEPNLLACTTNHLQYIFVIDVDFKFVIQILIHI